MAMEFLLKKIKNLLIRLIKPICKRNFINDLPKNSLVLDLGVDNNSQNFFFHFGQTAVIMD